MSIEKRKCENKIDLPIDNSLINVIFNHSSTGATLKTTTASILDSEEKIMKYAPSVSNYTTNDHYYYFNGWIISTSGNNRIYTTKFTSANRYIWKKYHVETTYYWHKYTMRSDYEWEKYTTKVEYRESRAKTLNSTVTTLIWSSTGATDGSATSGYAFSGCQNDGNDSSFTLVGSMRMNSTIPTSQRWYWNYTSPSCSDRIIGNTYYAACMPLSYKTGTLMRFIEKNTREVYNVQYVTTLGSFIEKVYSSNSSQYPTNGQSGGYWYYKRNTDMVRHPNLTSYETVTSTSSTTYTNNSENSDGYYYERTSQTTTAPGSLIGTIESTNSSAYPSNGKHSDGYWYIKQ